MRVRPYRRLSTELIILNCGTGEDSWESWDSMEIKVVNPTGNQLWIFFEKTYAEADSLILWPPDVKRLIGKDPYAGKNWGQEEKMVTKDEIVGWHLWLNEHMSESCTCPSLCNPTDYTGHGILQTRILKWVVFPFSRGSSQPRDRTQVSWTAGGCFTSWATREAQGYWSG